MDEFTQIIDSALVKSIKKIEDKAHEYEKITMDHDPQTDNMIRAIAIIKDFIKARDLVIYGGTAIDFALRLKGDKITGDHTLSIPDLDFYSPDSVADAYDLCNILFDNGFKYTRAIVGQYTGVMRVDIGDNHFAADIAYMTKSAFDSLPVLVYDGMKIISPYYQLIDAYRSLSYPYENPPRENIFFRLSKDVKRSELLLKYYPPDNVKAAVGADKPKNKVSMMSVADGVTARNVFMGVPAVAISFIYALNFARECSPGAEKRIKDIIEGVFPLNCAYFEDDLLKCAAVESIEILSIDPGDLAQSLLEIMDGEAGVNKYAKYTNILPSHYSVTSNGDVIYRIYSARDGFSSICSMEKSVLGYSKSESKLRITPIPYQVSVLLGRYFLTRDSVYLDIYIALSRVAREVGDIITRLKENGALDMEKHIDNNPFVPSVAVYGREEVSESYKRNRYNTLSGIGIAEGIEEFPPLPQSYRPVSMMEKLKNGEIPPFDYDKSELFVRDGRLLE